MMSGAPTRRGFPKGHLCHHLLSVAVCLLSSQPARLPLAILQSTDYMAGRYAETYQMSLTAPTLRCTLMASILMASALTSRWLSLRLAAMPLMHTDTRRCLPVPTCCVNNMWRHAGGRPMIIHHLYGSSHATQACSHPHPVAACRMNSIEHTAVAAVSGQFRCALRQTLNRRADDVRGRTSPRISTLARHRRGAADGGLCRGARDLLPAAFVRQIEELFIAGPPSEAW
ncbi:unnamed protein product [Prorocentrum cordatum]|uniref:Secreted protein n=1 Tax=Prorocentrum cordatum TaxID=2364126 RepID=A0ABN9R9K7_9DINO|nr:unnamed protein product [Polarella glacialis]